MNQDKIDFAGNVITRLCGVMFIGFAINALAHALPGLVTNKA